MNDNRRNNSILSGGTFVLILIVSVVCFAFLFGKNNNANYNNNSNGSLRLGETGKHEEFIKSLGGVSDTFIAGVSKESYTTSQAAATAYVEEQIAGEQEVKIINTASSRELSKKEIQELMLSEEDGTGVLSVEEIEVEYSIVSDSVTSTATLNTTKKIKVYIIKYENDFKYYTPCPVTGQTINKSYYDSVFDAEKYKNCTYNLSMEMSGKASAPGEGIQTFNISIDQKLCFTESAILLEQTTTGSVPGYAEAKNIINAYMVKQPNNSAQDFICYISIDGGEWYEGDLTTIGFSGFEELTPFYDQYLDYTYFTKTDYGFELSKENAEKYVKESLSLLTDIVDYNELDLDMFAKYYVSQGVLSGARCDAKINYLEDGATVNLTVVSEMTATNYGTTVVKKPFYE